MRPLNTLILLALMPGTGAADSSSRNSLLVRPLAAVAEITAQAAGRRQVHLPSLEFEISVTAQCEADAHPETITISVADTQTVYRVDEGADDTSFETTLRVPRPQLAPLAIQSFCVRDEPGSGTVQSLLIRAAMTAHVSLRCAGEDGASVHFKTVPLDIRLVCKPAGNVADGQPQETSDDSF